MRIDKLKRISILLFILTVGTCFLWRLAPGPLPERRQILGLDETVSPSQKGTVLPDIIVYAPVEPVAGSLDHLAADNSVGTSKYERWLRGELGPKEEFRLSASELATRQAESGKLPTYSGITSLTDGADNSSPTLGVSFDSLDVNDCCASGATVPPDPELSAGINHLIAVVNVAFEVYDKNGQSLSGPVTLSSFFAPLGGSSCTAGGPFDPNTLYDEAADRFLIAADGAGRSYCVAVSQTNDPTGNWWLYEFPMSTVSGSFFDYPHAAIGREAIYMGANLFLNQNFAEGRVWAFDKAALYAGTAVGAVSRSTGFNSTPQPVNLHGFAQGTWPVSGPHYILTDGLKFDGAVYSLYAWDDPFGANLFGLVANLDLPAMHGVPIGFPINSIQAGGNSAGDILSNDVRVLDFENRNGSGWTTMTVACNPGSGTVNCIQWAEIDLASASLIQAGVLASEGDFRYFPDIAANHCGDAALGYTKSGAALFPSVWATGRQQGDPPGAMQVEVEIKPGEVTYSAFDIDIPPLGLYRWGDYSGMTIDPDGLTFWYLGEYSKDVANPGANWGNHIGSLIYPDCSAEPDFRLNANPPRQAACLSNDIIYDINVVPLGAFNEPVTLNAIDSLAGYTASFGSNPVLPPGNSTLTLTHTATALTGSYELNVRGISLSRVHTVTLGVDLMSAVPMVTQLLMPADGSLSMSLTPPFSWTAVDGAAGYQLEVASDLQFTNVIFSATTASLAITPTIELAPDTTFYWRVTANNICGDGPASSTFMFTTANYICRTPMLDIPDNEQVGVSDSLSLTLSGKIVDLDLFLDVDHSWVGDLQFTLAHERPPVIFIDRPGVNESDFFGCAGDNIKAVIDDEGIDGSVETSCGQDPALSGFLTPNPGLLAEFDEQNLAGNWTLTASDHAGTDTGHLNRWCLIPTTVSTNTLVFLPLVTRRNTAVFQEPIDLP